MTEAAIGVGSNLGDRQAHLTGAVKALAALEGTAVIAVSSLWETPPWGRTDQPHFLNACVLVETSLSPMATLQACLETERAHGRERTVRWGARTLDMDLLFHGDTVMNTETLTLPHPRAVLRSFVIAPLAEIAPDRVLAGEPVSSHLARLGMEGLRQVGAFPHWRI